MLGQASDIAKKKTFNEVRLGQETPIVTLHQNIP